MPSSIDILAMVHMCKIKLHYHFTVFLEWLVQVVAHLEALQYGELYNYIVKQLHMNNIKYFVSTNVVLVFTIIHTWSSVCDGDN